MHLKVMEIALLIMENHEKIMDFFLLISMETLSHALIRAYRFLFEL